MSAYPLEKLLRHWARGDLSTEQAVGQILQIIAKLQDRVQEVENKLFRRERSEKESRIPPTQDASA
jgi:hypothetical protein